MFIPEFDFGKEPEPGELTLSLHCFSFTLPAQQRERYPDIFLI